MQKIPWNYFATGMLCLLFLMPASSSAGQQGAGAWNDIGAAVGQVQSGLADAREKGRLSFDLQKQLLKKSGDCISAMAELEQKTDFSKSGAKEDAKALFIKNGGVLRELLSLNRSKIAALEETKLEHAQDPSALFASAEWQEPQALVLLSGYWLSWNNYYCALLYAADDGKRHELLEEALKGFGSTLLDVREEAVMLRSLFGRALCLKEMGRYDKALQDLNSVTAKAGRENSLYAQAAYEKALISYLTGKYEKALGQLKELEADPAAGRVLKDAPKRLASKIALTTLEKSTAQRAGSAGGNDRDTLKELKRLAETNEAQAGALYQFVAGHAAELKDTPDAELGSMGSLAIADWHFNQKQYDAALARYRRLYALPDQSLQTYRGDVCFRLAYCLCNKSEWQEALGCLETLFEKYPRSAAAGQAACLYYLAAATTYRQNSSPGTYSYYIRAAQSYLKNCPDPKDKSEAHYQVGSYYQNKNMEKEALAEFALVGSDNPHYGQSRRAAIAAGVEEIESLHRQGAGQTDGAKKLYQKTLSQLQECRKVLSGKGGAAEGKELEAQLIILQARLAACGPDEAAKTALDLLAGFETRFSQSKQSAQLVYGAKVLRIESLLRLGMLKEADGEMAALLKEGGSGQDAWTFLNQAALAYYDRATASRGRGDSAAAKKEGAQALAVYARLCEASGLDEEHRKYQEPLQLRTAELYAADGQSAQARALYEQVLQRNPQSGDAKYCLALLYEKDGDWDKALAAWTGFAQGLSPGSHRWFEARYRAAQAFIKLGKIKEACEMLSMTRTLHPELGTDELRGEYAKLQEAACGDENSTVKKAAPGSE